MKIKKKFAGYRKSCIHSFLYIKSTFYNIIARLFINLQYFFQILQLQQKTYTHTINKTTPKHIECVIA